jgi:hypothetical protein
MHLRQASAYSRRIANCSKAVEAPNIQVTSLSGPASLRHLKIP